MKKKIFVLIWIYLFKFRIYYDKILPKLYTFQRHSIDKNLSIPVVWKIYILLLWLCTCVYNNIVIWIKIRPVGTTELVLFGSYIMLSLCTSKKYKSRKYKTMSISHFFSFFFGILIIVIIQVHNIQWFFFWFFFFFC